MKFVARRYDTSEIVSIHVAEGRIRRIEPVDVSADGSDVPWVSPGLVDLQVNGHGGQEFSDPSLTVEDVGAISAAMDRDGVTRYCPTVTSNGFETLSHALATIARACEERSEVAARVAGIHLEGPYISPQDGPRGAHALQHVRPPAWDEFQRLFEVSDSQMRILTMSPEHEGSAEFISKVVDAGVIVAIGHTAANSDQIEAAVDAGARLSTHLGNGAHGQLRRHPNYIWDQLAEDRLVASLIADGHHLPPAVVKTFVRAKSPERCILVSDITGMGGMQPGLYENSSLGAVEVLEDGRLAAAGQRQLLAGATSPLGTGIVNMLRFTDENLQSVLDMATTRPLALIAADPVALKVDSPADLAVFHLPGVGGDGPIGDLEVVATINSGELVYGSLPARP